MKKSMYVFKWILMSLITLIAGFAAISLPFKLFSLSGDELRYFFIAEILIYLAVILIFLVRKQKKQERIAKEKRLRLERRKKFEKAQEEYYSLAA